MLLPNRTNRSAFKMHKIKEKQHFKRSAAVQCKIETQTLIMEIHSKLKAKRKTQVFSFLLRKQNNELASLISTGSMFQSFVE